MPYKDRKKQAIAQHKSYILNKGIIKSRKRKDVEEKRAYVKKVKDVPCADCGIKYPSYVMDFDHLNPEEKEGRISYLVHLSWKRLKKEIDKCEVVCSNCHRIRTQKHRINGIFVYR